MKLSDLWKSGRDLLEKRSVGSAGRARSGGLIAERRGPHGTLSGHPRWHGQPLPRNLLYPDDLHLSFLEELRRTVPVVDRSLAVLVGLVGKLAIEGSKNATDEVETFFRRVRVNQHQRGFQEWLAGQVDSMLHYGKGVGEIVPNRSRTELFALTNIDPRSIIYRVTNDPLVLDVLQREAWNAELVELNAKALVVSTNGAHVDRPHGVSLFRSVPFVAQCVRLVENATAQQWKRVGAPPYHLNWEPPPTFSDPQGTLARSVREALKEEWDGVMGAKDPETNTVVDFITSGKITVTTIGADGQPASLVEPARHFLEQLVAVTGLPPWMLGFNWSNTQQLATEQKEVLIAHIEAIRRQVFPACEEIVDARMRLAGKSGRYTLEWSKITLHDQIEQARAKSYEAQAEQHGVENAIQMWRMGWIDQLTAAQRVDEEIKAVATPYDQPPAAPTPAAAFAAGDNPAPPLVQQKFGANAAAN